MKYKIVSSFDKNSMCKLDFEPTLAIAFYVSSSKSIFLESYNYISDFFPKLDVFAVSSESNIFHTLPYIDSKKHNEIFVFLDIDKKYYSISKINMNKNSSHNPFESANAIFFSLSHIYVESKIQNIESKLGDGGQVYGMMAATSKSEDVPSLFYNGEFLDDTGIICYIDSSKYGMNGVAIHNFEPIGLRLEITKAQTNTIYELENRLALDVIEEIIGKIEQDEIDSFSHPLFLMGKNENVDEYSLLSSIDKIDRESRSITLCREVTTHYSAVKLAIPIGIEDERLKLNKLKENSLDRGLLFLFACIGVKRFYGQHEHMKLMLLSKKLKNKFVGCHTYGEIAPSINKTFSELQNHTFTFVSIFEKDT